MSEEVSFRLHLREYAEHLILTRGITKIPLLTIREASREFFNDPIGDSAAFRVADLISRARVTVEFPECCPDCTAAAKEATDA